MKRLQGALAIALQRNLKNLAVAIVAMIGSMLIASHFSAHQTRVEVFKAPGASYGYLTHPGETSPSVKMQLALDASR
jgi:hypothetical protein